MPDHQPDQRGPVLFLVLLAMVALIVIAWGVGREDANGEPSVVEQQGAPAPRDVETAAPPVVEPVETPAAKASTLPGGGTEIFGDNHFLVAYYGTGQTPASSACSERPTRTPSTRRLRARPAVPGPRSPACRSSTS